MYNQGITDRTLLELIHPRNGIQITGIRRQALPRFSRDRHQAARPQTFTSLVNIRNQNRSHGNSIHKTKNSLSIKGQSVLKQIVDKPRYASITVCICCSISSPRTYSSEIWLVASRT